MTLSKKLSVLSILIAIPFESSACPVAKGNYRCALGDATSHYLTVYVNASEPSVCNIVNFRVSDPDHQIIEELSRDVLLVVPDANGADESRVSSSFEIQSEFNLIPVVFNYDLENGDLIQTISYSTSSRLENYRCSKTTEYAEAFTRLVDETIDVQSFKRSLSQDSSEGENHLPKRKRRKTKNKSTWTDEQDELLASAINKKHLLSRPQWKKISITGKSDQQISKRYRSLVKQGHLNTEENKDLIQAQIEDNTDVGIYLDNLAEISQYEKAAREDGPWDKKEDEALISILSDLQDEDISWSLVSKVLFDRTGIKRDRRQCHRHWPLIDPKLKKDRWTPEQDEKLIQAVRKHTSDDDPREWSKIAADVGKNNEQCRVRWKTIRKNLTASIDALE